MQTLHNFDRFFRTILFQIHLGCEGHIMRFASVTQDINKRQKTLSVKLFYDPGVAAFSFSSGKRPLYQVAVHS